MYVPHKNMCIVIFIYYYRCVSWQAREGLGIAGNRNVRRRAHKMEQGTATRMAVPVFLGENQTLTSEKKSVIIICKESLVFLYSARQPGAVAG